MALIGPRAPWSSAKRNGLGPLVVDRASDQIAPALALDTNRQPFVQMPESVLTDPELTVYAKLLYCALKRYAWQKGRCHPGVRRLAGDLHLGTNTVWKHLVELEWKGWISVDRGRHNEYTLHQLPIRTTPGPGASSPPPPPERRRPSPDRRSSGGGAPPAATRTPPPEERRNKDSGEVDTKKQKGAAAAREELRGEAQQRGAARQVPQHAASSTDRGTPLPDVKVPMELGSLDRQLRQIGGYQPTPEFFKVVQARLGDIDLDAAAIKVVAYHQTQRNARGDLGTILRSLEHAANDERVDRQRLARASASSTAANHHTPMRGRTMAVYDEIRQERKAAQAARTAVALPTPQEAAG